MDMTNLLGEEIGIIIGYTSMNLYNYEYNYRALVLEETLKPQFTPQRKHYDSEYSVL